MQSFDKFVGQAALTKPVLPLVHITDGYCMRLILEEKRLEPQHCDVLKQPALYFSYGRPSFRPNGGALPSALTSYAPVCFVIDAAAIPIAKAFPFDSGAFSKKMFASSTHRKMQLKNFELSATLDRPQQVVTTFFGDNTSYFDNSPKSDVHRSPLQFEVESFIALLNDKQSEHYDDRISAVEIISQTSILLEGKIKAMVFPGQFLDDSTFTDALAVLRCDAIPYPLGARFSGEGAFARVSVCVRDYLVKSKLLG